MNCTKNMNKSYRKMNYLRFPVLGLIALFLRRGPAKSQVRVYLEKRTILPGFRVHDSRRIHKKNRIAEKIDEAAAVGCRNSLSSLFAS